MPLQLWTRIWFEYVDDFGNKCALEFNDYLGDAGGLRRFTPGEPRGYRPVHLKARRVRVRSLQPDINTGKKGYRDIPVLTTNPLWQGELGQIVVIHDDEYETIELIPEKEYGRKKRLAQMKTDAAAQMSPG